MKHPYCLSSFLAVGALALFATNLFSAGPLVPPGPPAPIYKTLDEVEPRTPIDALPFIITQPGSYYLVDNLVGVANQNGIDIRANSVTLDLRGFALRGIANSFDGIRTTGSRTNIAIVNGTIENWGNDGIDLSSAFSSQLRDLRSSGNAFEGMQVGSGGLVINCTSRANGQDGIDAGFGCTILGCATSANTGDGIVVLDGSNVNGCTATENTGDGIQARSDCQILNNTCDGNGAAAGVGAGIHITSTDNRVEGNNITDNDRGLDIDSRDNIVANNTVRRNTDNYDIAQGNQLNILLGQIPESIDWPCNVLLAGSLTGTGANNGITVNTNDITIDLGGHALLGVAGSLDGIRVNGSRTNITVRNGTVRGWGQDGVDAGSAYNSVAENVNASNNGSRGMAVGPGGAVSGANARANGGNGIVVSTGCRVSNSSSSENGSIGIDMSTGSIAEGCSAFNNGSVGIDASTGCSVSGCASYSNTGYGINASAASTVNNCAVSANSTNGIVGSNGAKISGCAVRANTGHGIYVTSDSYVFNNQIDEHFGDAAINVTGSDNRIDSNAITDCTTGINVTSSGNLIIRNSVSGASTAYSIAAGNTAGVIQGIANPVSNAVGPWANFSF